MRLASAQMRLPRAVLWPIGIAARLYLIGQVRGSGDRATDERGVFARGESDGERQREITQQETHRGPGTVHAGSRGSVRADS